MDSILRKREEHNLHTFFYYKSHIVSYFTVYYKRGLTKPDIQADATHATLSFRPKLGNKKINCHYIKLYLL